LRSRQIHNRLGDNARLRRIARRAQQTAALVARPDDGDSDAVVDTGFAIAGQHAGRD